MEEEEVEVEKEEEEEEEEEEETTGWLERYMNGEPEFFREFKEEMNKRLDTLKVQEMNLYAMIHELKELDALIDSILEKTPNWATTYCDLFGLERNPENYMKAITIMCCIIVQNVLGKAHSAIYAAYGISQDVLKAIDAIKHARAPKGDMVV